MKKEQQKGLIIIVLLLLAAGPVFAKKREEENTVYYGPAALSYLGQSSLPRGLRNNNPGNLKISSSNWQGKIPESQNTDGVFEQFKTFAYGVRAMIKLIRDTYMTKWNLRTIRQIVSKYAPTSENDTGSYVYSVSAKTGFGPDQQLGTDKETLRRLVQAMAYHENGRMAIDDEFFNLAWSML